MNQKQNHPKQGSRIKVEPFRKLKDIQNIKKILADKPRDLALFTIGINTNLRQLKISITPILQHSMGRIIGTVLHMRLSSNDIYLRSDKGSTREINRALVSLGRGLCAVTPRPM